MSQASYRLERALGVGRDDGATTRRSSCDRRDQAGRGGTGRRRRHHRRRDVHKWFGQLHVLRGIDLTVPAGEVVVIFGASGSGKSTFIRTINRLEEHQRGEIIVDGIELTNDIRNIAAIRSEIGMVFQQFNLFPHLTALAEHHPGADAGAAAARGPRPSRRHGAARARGHPGAGAQVPRAAIRRSAAARGDRAGAGDAAEDHAVRRAHLGARPGDDQRGAGRHAGAGSRRA